MISSPSYRSHSADVSMRLLLDGVSMRIAQMGPDFLIIDADAAHSPGNATIQMRVDASESQWDVYLPQGIVASGRQEVMVTLPLGQKVRQEVATEMARSQ